VSSADFEAVATVNADELHELMAQIEAHPDVLEVLPEETQHQAAVDLLAARNMVYKADIWTWLRDCVLTIDEASQAASPWPDRAYLRELFTFIDEHKMVVIPKSRRMMVTWAVAAWCVHKARYFPNYAIFVQSETEDKAAYVIDKRCAFIEDNLTPEALRRTYSSIRTTKGAIGRMTYRDTRSYLWGIPQGGDVLRTYTPSVLFMDEADFQPEGHQALTAALPAAEKGAKLILVSSSNGPSGVVAGVCKEVGFLKWGS